MGGEKFQSGFQRNNVPGSPPRGRGKGGFNGSQFEDVGITPAWAGKRYRYQGGAVTPRDHPRVGGEKRLCGRGSGGMGGSPPRGRGKGLLIMALSINDGITPAWAGKRLQSLSVSGKDGDHPRVGGEKPRTARPTLKERGSPPRGRGKATHSFTSCSAPGITPAWAGKSSPHVACNSINWDHPRVGGEKPDRIEKTLMLLGSPPRGRGKD